MTYLRRFVFGLALLLLLVLLSGIGLALQTWYGKPLQFEWFIARVTLEQALASPETLSAAGVLEPYGFRGHNAQLDDRSIAAEDAAYARDRANLATLRAYTRADLDDLQADNYDVMQDALESRIAGEPYRFHSFAVNQSGGVQSALPGFIINFQSAGDAEDGERYVQRLRAFPARFAAERERLAVAYARHIRPPRFLVDAVLTEMRAFTATEATQNALYLDLQQKLAAAQVDASDQRRLLAAAAQALTSDVYPAYTQLIDWFARVQPTLVRNDGAWALPHGARYYAHCIRLHTGMQMRADDLHKLGLDEVARIGMQMDSLLRGLGYRDGSIGTRVRAFAAAPTQQYPDNAAGRIALLRDYRQIVARAMPTLRARFSRLPKARLEVRAVPAFSAASSPVAYYYGPTLSADSPGVFYVNLQNVRDLPRFTMATLAYHEAVPGHHFQIALAQENRALPLFRRMIGFTAYSEGWALYAEQLASELGLSVTPTDELGRLQSEMFRAVRLVVDTGLHSRRWSREQAIAYMIDATGMGDTEVAGEIERYLVDPGQALAYKVGMLHILALRTRAQAELGARFDLRDFHEAVLAAGAVPLSVLTTQVERYIARRANSLKARA